MIDKSWKAKLFEGISGRNGCSWFPRQYPVLMHLSTTEIRLMILGACGVGKSITTARFTKNQYVDSYEPATKESIRKQISFLGNPLILDILDLAAQDAETLSIFYYIAVHSFILMYSTTDYASFSAISDYYAGLQKRRSSTAVPVVLVGNKIDLFAEREVSTEEGIELAKKLNVPFFEISAKTAVNVQEMFMSAVWEGVLHKRLGSFGTADRQEKCIVM